MVVSVVCAIFIAQLQIGPDEVRVRSGPYFPLGASGVIRTSVDLVEVATVVRDSNGSAVTRLKREDFELFDSGKKREITSFAIADFSHGRANSAAPGKDIKSGANPHVDVPAKPVPEPLRFIALVFDNLNTSFQSLYQAKAAARKYVSESLSQGDRVAIYTPALTQNVAVFTRDAAELKRDIDAIRPVLSFVENPSDCPHISPYEAFAITHDLVDRDSEGQTMSALSTSSIFPER